MLMTWLAAVVVFALLMMQLADVDIVIVNVVVNGVADAGFDDVVDVVVDVVVAVCVVAVVVNGAVVVVVR